jgi:hypothetical protein
MRGLRVALWVIGVFQLVLGAGFLLAPVQMAQVFGLVPTAPGWANWLFAMMGVRFLGYGYGMFVAARSPRDRLPWIDTMIAIQAVDWVATMIALHRGFIHLPQVTPAAVAPVFFILALLWWHPRRRRFQES